MFARQPGFGGTVPGARGNGFGVNFASHKTAKSPVVAEKVDGDAMAKRRRRQQNLSTRSD